MYKALKACKFGPGQSYNAGDIIPEGVIADTAVNRLINMGYITSVEPIEVEVEVEGESNSVYNIDTCLTIFADGERLEPTDKGIQDIFTVMIGAVSKAESVIKQMTDEEALKLLALADNRKAVKAMAESRAQELSEEAGEA